MRPDVTAVRTRRLLVISTVLIVLGGTAWQSRGDDTGSSPIGGVSGPPAPAVPAIAATPAPVAPPALPNAPLEPGVAAREEPVEPPSPDAQPRSVNLWPLFQYDSDPATRTKRVRIFGPLIEYRTDAERQAIFVRPFVSIDQSRVGHDDDVRFLGPLLTSHWGQTEQVTTGFGGLFTYRTRTSADGRTREAQHARLLPLYFYEWDQSSPAGRISLIPVYADIEDFLGYERVEMVAFPVYLHLQRPALDRYYYPYPIISRDGPPGSGYRLWPFPLRDRQGRRIERHATAAEPEPQTYFPLWRDELDATEPRPVSADLPARVPPLAAAGVDSSRRSARDDPRRAERRECGVVEPRGTQCRLGVLAEHRRRPPRSACRARKPDRARNRPLHTALTRRHVDEGPGRRGLRILHQLVE
jgi:hypothetical protein